MKKILYSVLALAFAISLYSAERAHIQVISEPGITIFLNDIFIGSTSDEMGGLIIEDIVPGPVAIKSVKPGFNPQVKNVVLHPGEVYTMSLEDFIPKIEITQSGNYDEEDIGLQVGAVTIQSLPISIDIEIPGLSIFDKKIKDEWKASNIPVGSYVIKYSWQNKIMRDSIHIRPDWNTRTFVNFIKNTIDEKDKYVAPKIRKKLDKYGMVYVKGSIYQIGSNSGEKDEAPIHSVRVNDFYIGRYEVTIKEYLEFMNEMNLSSYGSLDGHELIDVEDPDCPIEYVDGKFQFRTSKYAHSELCPIVEVSWQGAVEYCKWLSGYTGESFRLPTEAEWQYAARGGLETEGFLYSGSDDITEVAWYALNAGNILHEVGKKKPNELGIYDMSGNAWEWCHDWYKKDYYQHMGFDNPQGPGRGFRRVIQGGSVSNSADRCRSTARYNSSPASRTWTNGFRVLMEVPGDK